jgi:hypothetical protein
MKKYAHRITISIYTLIVVCTFVLLAWYGRSYYTLPIGDRYFHPQYELLKPSGYLGHGLGITGAFFILTGLVIYSLRKRVKTFSGWGRLKNWLDFHIFLCTWGTVMVLFHTTFKFGGVIAIGFWSLAIVWISGVIGRFIYIQIPRTIEGNEISLNELLEKRKIASDLLWDKYKINFSEIKNTGFSKIRLQLIANSISKKEFRHIRILIRKQKISEQRIKRLDLMRNLFHYWHIAHVPFAVIMVVILIIHVSVVLFFGYKWIF